MRSIELVERRWRWILSMLMLLDAALLLYMGRGFSFFGDDWSFVMYDSGPGIHSLLLAHNGNISIVPAAIYKVLFHLVGLNHYAVYRLVVILSHLLSAGLIFLLASRRLPRAPALLATLLIMFLDAAWEDLLWAFQVGYLVSVVGGLATWVLLERKRRWSDVAAMLCLVVAMGSSSVGIAFMAGVFVELAWQRQGKRLWIVAVPAALYLLWYLSYGESQVTTSSVIHSPGYVLDIAAAAFGAVAGRGLGWGRPLALVGVLAMAARLMHTTSVTPRLLGLLATGLTLWIVTALARSTISPPWSSRYTYLGAVVIVLVGVELLRGITISPHVAGLAAAIVAVSIAAGLTIMKNATPARLENGEAVTAELGALELAAAYARPDYQVDPTRAPTLAAGPYLHAVRAIGSSPAHTPAKIIASEPDARAAADATLLALEIPKLAALTSMHMATHASAPSLLALTAGIQVRRGGCLDLTPVSSSTMTATIDLPRDGILIEDRGARLLSMALKRFATGFSAIPHTVSPHSGISLSIPGDSSTIPWQLQANSSSPFSLCGAGA